MKVVICDDEKKDANNIYDTISRFCTKHSIDIMSPYELLVAVEEELLKYDIAILDICFRGEDFDGIYLGKRINEIIPECQIIYISEILDFAPEVYDTRHCYFVMKNNMKVMLPRAIKKAEAAYKELFGGELIEFLCGGKKIILAQKDIVYIERDNRLLRIHTTVSEYMCYESLKKILPKLSKNFVRCHGGFVVNMDFVSGMDKENLTMYDGNVLPIGKTFANNMRQKYLMYYSVRM